MTRVKILGVSVDCFERSESASVIRSLLTKPGASPILAVNPEKVMRAQHDSKLRTALDRAELLIPDGIGVVLAARLFQGARIERIPGAEFMPEICAVCCEEDRSVFVLGGTPGVATHALENLLADLPGLRIAGVENGYFEPQEEADIVARINGSGADVLFVGLGSPRQEQWIADWQDALNVQLIQGIGGTLDVLAGAVRRAPDLLRRLNLEWCYRLITQPGRLRRQLLLPQFAWLAILEASRKRLGHFLR